MCGNMYHLNHARLGELIEGTEWDKGGGDTSTGTRRCTSAKPNLGDYGLSKHDSDFARGFMEAAKTPIDIRCTRPVGRADRGYYTEGRRPTARKPWKKFHGFSRLWLNP